MEIKRRKSIKWKRIFIQILAFCSVVFLPIGIIFFLFLTLFFLVYRKFVEVFAHYFRPDLTFILPIGLSLFALRGKSERPKLTILIQLVLDGPIPLEEFKEKLISRVLQKTKDNEHENETGQIQSANENEHRENLFYPELRQTWTNFMGFYFWKWEQNFNVNQHARFYFDSDSKCEIQKREKTDSKKVQEICERLMSEPWKNDFSPWEFLFIPNFVQNSEPNGNEQTENETQKTCVIIRFHHAMGDGYGWLKLLMEDLLQDKQFEMSSPSPPKISRWRLLLAPLKMPYDLTRAYLESFDTFDASRNPWHSRQKMSREYWSSVSPSFPVARIKTLKNGLGVSYSAVLTTVICGAIRRVIQEAGQNVPNKMTAFQVLPLPNHPGGIRLHGTGIFTRWPIGTENQLKRVQEIVSDLQEKKNSLFPLAFPMTAGLLQNFPLWFQRLFYNQLQNTLCASFFPGPLSVPQFLGAKVSDSAFYFGLPAGKMGTGISTMVMSGKQRIVVIVDKTLFPSGEIFSKLGGFMLEELEMLENLSKENHSHHENHQIIQINTV